MLENFEVNLPKFEILELPGSSTEGFNCILHYQFQITKTEVTHEASRMWISEWIQDSVPPLEREPLAQILVRSAP